jgi:SAM-dependent methyltransferase
MKTYSDFIKEHVFNESIAGKSVLEFGSFGGHITHIIKQAGPSSIYTVDPAPHVGGVDHDFKGTANDFFKMGSNPLNRQGASFQRFDVVVCMGVLYHLHSPYHLLEQIINRIKPEKLIVETGGSYNDHWAPKNWQWEQKIEDVNTLGNAYADEGVYYPIKVSLNKGREQMVQAIETTPYKMDKYFVYKDHDLEYKLKYEKTKKDMWIGVFNEII